ncbi:MAG: TauD/TfdA family dioxygenase [Proteobacteria bacterium]|nr:TauD/TfdA family dioxygenase [Pseudomonadota bacterium]
MPRTMEVVPTNATLGAIVRGVELGCVDKQTFTAIETAWHKYAVLIFEEQTLTDDQHLAFSRRFGRLERGLMMSSKRLLAHLSNVTRDGSIADPTSLQVRFNKGNEHWHTDSSYKRVGAKASLLYARSVPDTGGETEWADMREAYDALDNKMQTWLEDKMAVHSYRYSHAWHGGLELLGEDDLARLPPVEHPVVKIHPATGRKILFVGRHASHLLGEDIDASRAMLKRLTEEACQAPRTFKHRWREGDLAIWDNRCVLHRGHPWPMDQVRDMVRSTVAGDDLDNEWAEVC